MFDYTSSSVVLSIGFLSFIPYYQAFSKHASEVLPLYNSLVAKTYDEADSSGGNSMKDWSSDSFYQGQNHSYSKPYLNFLRNKGLGTDGNESQFTRED